MLQKRTTNNKRIAKNTLYLYLRMAFSMLISLYTSRVVLNTLGIEDYGIFNVVGGIITLLAFINGGMLTATQRYLTFEMGKKNMDKLKAVFYSSIQIHRFISVVVVLLGSTVGYWFLIHKMNIPTYRLEAAIWVYFCSIFACATNILSVPYNADIIANEKMSAFAYISIIESILKLLIVFLLVQTNSDKLIAYAILLMAIQMLTAFSYYIYCKFHFEETKCRNSLDFSLLKEMTKFAGWSFFGNFAAVLYTQGVNILLNIFFGPSINAARAVSIQVQGAVSQFVSNFQMAVNPQITKKYATSCLDDMYVLMFRCARFSFILLYLVTLPVLLEAQFILTLWLKQVPDNSALFLRIILLISLLYTTVNPCVIAIQATGDIKKYQVVVGGIILTILPVSYLILKLGAPAYSVFIIHLIIECIAQITRLYILRVKIKMPMSIYFKEVYLPIIYIVTLSLFIPIYINLIMTPGLMRFIVGSSISILSVLVISFFWGLKDSERKFLVQKIKNIRTV